MSDETARAENIQRLGLAWQEQLGPLDRLIRRAFGNARQAPLYVAGGQIEQAEHCIDEAYRAASEVRVVLERLREVRYGDKVEAKDMARRAHARAGMQQSEQRVEEIENRKAMREVIPLEAKELFGVDTRRLGSADVLQAMADKGVDSQFIGEYLAELVERARTHGTDKNKREVMKLVFAFIQHIEPKATLDVEDDLEDLSDEELEAYQTIAARQVARAHQKGD